MTKNAAVAPVTTLHLAAQGERTTIARSKLFKAPENVRKTPRSAESLEELAALIKTQGGVLENLMAYAERKKGKLTGHYAVTAGGGRLDAVDLLVGRGEFQEDYQFPVLIVPQHLAVEVSLAENSGREPMHPADEFDAFKAMFDEGKTHEEIGARFGVSPLVVARRLKLANVAQVFLSMYREGGIKLEQLMALALTDDHAAQVAVWDALPHYNRHAYNIKSYLTKGEENIAENRFGLFVGADAYEAAGGCIRHDLFSDSGAGYITDIPLLLKLAQDKLEMEAEALRASGVWAWVEVVADSSDFDNNLYTVAKKVKRDPTAEEKAALDAVEKEHDRLGVLVESTDGDDEGFDALYEQFEQAEQKLEALNANLYFIDPTQQKKAGVVLGINQDGSLSVRAGLLHRKAKNDKQTTDNGTDGQTESATKRPAHSEKLVRMLTAQRTAAVQRMLVDRPDIALIAMTAQLAAAIKEPWHAGGVQIRATVENLESHGGDNIKSARAYQEMRELEETWAERLSKIDDVFAWLLVQEQQTVWELLAFCVARSVTTIQTRENSQHAGFLALAKALGLNMSDWWMPTAENYLGHISKAKAVDTVAEVLGNDATSDLNGMKRDVLVAAASSKLAGSGWVPALLKAE